MMLGHSRETIPILAAMALVACGDDLGPPPTDCPVAAPAVIATWPPGASTDVPTDAAIVATFATAIDPASVTEDTFRIDGIDGSRTAVGRTAVFVPDAPLPAGVEHTVTIGAGVRDEGGATLGGDHVWTFETRGTRRRWRETQFGAGSARVTHGPAGELIAVWSDDDDGTPDTPSNVFAASHHPGVGWSAVERLGTGLGPVVTVDDDGAAWVLWSSSTGLRGRRRTRCTGWEEEIGLGDVACGMVAVDPARGTHVAACRTHDEEEPAEHVALVFSASAGWSGTRLGAGAQDSALAFDVDGRAHFLLRWQDGAPCSAEIVVMNSDGGIEERRTVRDDASCVVDSPPSIAFAPSGHGVAAVSGSPFFVREFDPGSGWRDETTVLADAAENVAVSPRGPAVVWTTPGAESSIWSARRDGEGWTEPVLLGESVDRVTSLLVAGTATGDEILIVQRTNTPTLYARTAIDGAWGPLEILPAESLWIVSLSMSPGGDVAISGSRATLMGLGADPMRLATISRFE